jgi:hypothetical protein
MEAACNRPQRCLLYFRSNLLRAIIWRGLRAVRAWAPDLGRITELLLQSNHNQQWIGTLNPRLHALGKRK